MEWYWRQSFITKICLAATRLKKKEGSSASEKSTTSDKEHIIPQKDAADDPGTFLFGGWVGWIDTEPDLSKGNVSDPDKNTEN